jgi:hypothetical protein
MPFTFTSPSQHCRVSNLKLIHSCCKFNFFTFSCLQPNDSYLLQPKHVVGIKLIKNIHCVSWIRCWFYSDTENTTRMNHLNNNLYLQWSSAADKVVTDTGRCSVAFKVHKAPYELINKFWITKHFRYSEQPISAFPLIFYFDLKNKFQTLSGHSKNESLLQRTLTRHKNSHIQALQVQHLSKLGHWKGYYKNCLKFLSFIYPNANLQYLNKNSFQYLSQSTEKQRISGGVLEKQNCIYNLHSPASSL